MIRIGFELANPDAQTLRILLNALVNLNLLELRRQRLPKLYKAGVEYQREPKGIQRPEEWKTIKTLIQTGFGDCEDLATARVAELRYYYGIRAIPWLKKRNRTWHVLVKYPDGRIEDPSKILGMGKD